MKSIFAFVSVLILLASAVIADPPDSDAATLKQKLEAILKENELLKNRLKVVEEANEDLEKANETLAKDLETANRKGQKTEKQPKPKLSDLLPAGTELSGKGVKIGPMLVNAEFTLTITERDKNKCKGTYTAGDGKGLQTEVEGLITGDNISLYSVNSPRRITIKGGRKGESLDLIFKNEAGDQYRLTSKLPESGG